MPTRERVMRPVSIAVYPLACLVAAWVAGCATERLDAAAPTGVNLTGEWKFNPNLSDDPDKLADPDKAPQRSPGSHRGHGGRGGGGGGMPPMGSPPTAATTGHGWPGRIEIQGWLPGSEVAATTGFLPVSLTAPGIEEATPLPPVSTPATGNTPTGATPASR